MNTDLKYQEEYSLQYEGRTYNNDKLIQKAKKSISVMNDYLIDLNDKCFLDLGCSTGIMTNYYSKYFKKTIGIDIDEDAIKYALANNSNNIKFYLQTGDDTNFESNSFDVVTCTQIYEHVPDSKKLIDEIYRILKPGGICYFSAGNRLNIMESHHKLPLLSVIPKSLANHYLKLFRGKDYYYETHLTYWGLKKLVNKLDIIDYTKKVINDPEKFCMTEIIKPKTLKYYLSNIFVYLFYWACPTYIWILKKPKQNY